MAGLRQIFLECQHSVTSQPRLLKKMTDLYEKSDLKEFMGEFTRLLKYSLIHGDKQPTVERTLSFVVKFATSEKVPADGKDRQSDSEEEEADPFLENLIVFLIKNHNANCPAVRLRICQLLSMLLRQMGPKAVIDNELYDVIYDTMLHRLQDKIPGVRKEAVLALTRLQDPYNSECPVIEAYCFHLCKDPNNEVRRAVLNNIAVTYQTLPAILDRIRDTRELMRYQAYAVIAEKIHLKSLTIAQRVRLISEGLKDRHEIVRNCVKKKLIPSWLRQMDGKVLSFLNCLDVEASVKEAELVLKTIFEIIPFNELVKNIVFEENKRVVNHDNLRPESALYWRCLAQHLRESGLDETLEEILPDLTQFCSYMNTFVLAEMTVGEDEHDTAIRFMEKEFITNQLIAMALVYDLSDEVGRRSLDQMVRNLLVSDKVGESLVKGLVEIFSKLHPLSTRINQLAEIISEIHEPLCRTAEQVEKPVSEEEERKKKLKVASLKVKINQLREELQESMSNLDLEKAKTQKNELLDLEAQLSQPSPNTSTTEEVFHEPRNDPATLIKCLTIFCNIVECSEVQELTPALQTLHDNLILRCLRSEDPAVRNIAVQALGLLCLLSKDLAKQHITLLVQVSKIDAEKIQVTALRCIIDCLHLYGIEEFAEATEVLPDVLENPVEEQENEECVENGGAIIAALCERLDAESLEVRTLVAEGVCKLLLSSRITSSKLLSRLILMFYNPMTGEDSLLRHMLGVFFPLYACEDTSCQESLCEAFMPTLQTLLKAPSRSPLASVDVENVTNFLISIMCPVILPEELEEKVNVHDTLVFTLCTEILNNPTEWLSKMFLRCLNTLQLTPTNYSTLRQLDVIVSKIMKVIEGKGQLKTLTRFQEKIKHYLSSAPEADSAEGTVVDMTVTQGNAETSAVEETMMEERTDTTVIKRKRMLYDQTVNEPTLISGESESDLEMRSPSKKMVHSISLSQGSLGSGSITLGSPAFTSTQTKVDDPTADEDKKEDCSKEQEKDCSEELDKTVVTATHIVAESELELSQTPESGSTLDGQRLKQLEEEEETVKEESTLKEGNSEEEDSVIPASQESSSQRDDKFSEVRMSSVGDEADEESVDTTTSLQPSSDDEPTPPKVPHLTRQTYSPARCGRLRQGRNVSLDSDDFNASAKARRRIKSVPADPLHLSASNSSDSSLITSPSSQESIYKATISTRKRSKNLSDSLAKLSTPSPPSGRATRSRSKQGTPATPNTSGSPSLSITDNSPSAAKAPTRRSSRKLQSQDTRSPSLSSQSSQDSGSSRRSSRNRSKK